MQQHTQIALARELLRHIDAGTKAMADGVARNRGRVYTDPDRLAREWSIIRSVPQFIGLSGRLPAPGSFLTDDETGIPVLLVRGEDGRVRAFLNACRHRGARVVSGEGSGRRRFACPYHGWTYDCGGRLAGCRTARASPGWILPAATSSSCPRRSTAACCGRRSIHPARSTFERFLAGLGPELASYGFGDSVHYARRTLVRRLNWKMAIDTFLESYHFPVLHAESIHPLFLPNLSLFEPFGPHLREIFPRRTITELRECPESDWDLITHSVIIYVLFPSTVIVMQGDHAEIWRIFPDADRTDASVIHLDFYIPEPAETDSARRYWDRNLDLVLHTVENEDFPTGEGIQRGFAANPRAEVVYGRNEPALQHWQRTVADMLENGVNPA